MGPGLVSSTQVSSHPQETSLPLQNLPLLSHSRITKEVSRENIKKSKKEGPGELHMGPGSPKMEEFEKRANGVAGRERGGIY